MSEVKEIFMEVNVDITGAVEEVKESAEVKDTFVRIDSNFYATRPSPDDEWNVILEGGRAEERDFRGASVDEVLHRLAVRYVGEKVSMSARSCRIEASFQDGDVCNAKVVMTEGVHATLQS